MKIPSVVSPFRLLACGLLALPLSTMAADVGPGLFATEGADSGDRLNVDETFTQTLGPGTYSVANFSYYSTADVGSTVPFLATLNVNDTYDLIWIGGGRAGVLNGPVSADPAGFFTLTSTVTIYGGFYNVGGGRVAFASVPGQTVDHDSSFTIPRGGVTTTGFSNPGLNRSYSFSLAVQPTSMRVIGPGMLSNGGVDGGERLNIDQAHPFTLSAGMYDVDDFSFNGTAAAGAVTPFLVRGLGDNLYETVWVGQAAGGLIGDLSIDPGGSFTLGADETLYAGFYTADGARVAFTEGVGRPPGFGTTDHDDAFTGPVGAGESISGFTVPDLARQYSFSVGVTSVPEPASAGLCLAGLLAVGLRRRRG